MTTPETRAAIAKLFKGQKPYDFSKPSKRSQINYLRFAKKAETLELKYRAKQP